MKPLVFSLVFLGILVFVSGCTDQNPPPVVGAHCWPVSDDFNVKDNKIVSKSFNSYCEFSTGKLGAPAYQYYRTDSQFSASGQENIVPGEVLVVDRACIESINFPKNYNEIIIDTNGKLLICAYSIGV